VAPGVHDGRAMPRLPLVLVALGFIGCAVEDSGSPDDGRDDAFFGGGKGDGELSAAEIVAVLHVANTASLADLDDGAGLDARAASGIVAHRSGADAEDGTDDDDRFDDLAELDAVPWVGPTALDKLLAFADEQGGDRCLLISEYLEGKMAYNKGLEIYNCGDEPVPLSEYSLCLVRNDETDCTVTQSFGDVELAAGDVWVVCRSKEQAFSDPSPLLVMRCDEALGSVMINSGDDRMVLMHTPSGEDSIATGTVVDALGRIDFRPWWNPFQDVVLRRCRPDANPGTVFFEELEWFTEHFYASYLDLGVPPVLDGCE
jgi:hypothetical protein